MIVDLGGVDARDGKGRKELAKQIGAGFRQLVEEQRAAADLGEDGEQARAGRGLQHDVARDDRGRGNGGKSERDRRRELLMRLALLGTAGVRRQKAGDFRQSGKTCSRSVGFTEKRTSVFAQEQDGRAFAGFVGRLPVPDAARVGSLEGDLHGGAKAGVVDPLPAFEHGEKLMGGGDDGGRTDDGRSRHGDGR